MTQDDVLFGYRLSLFRLAGERGVSEACRLMGVHRSTYYAWKNQVERSGLEMLRPRERRAPQMPNQLSPIVEQRIVAFSLGHPGWGPKRVASRLARPEWGGLIVSPNGVYKTLCRHGLNTRAKRLALIAGYAAPFEPPRDPEPEPHISVDHPGELVGIDCFFVGRLHGAKGPVWQITAIDCYSSYAWAELVVVKGQAPSVEQTSRSPGGSPRPCRPPAGSSSGSSATTATSSAAASSAPDCPPAPTTPRSAPGARRPTATSNACTARSSKSAGGPRSRASYRSASADYVATSRPTSTTTTSSANTTDESRPGDAQPTSSTVPARWSRDEPHLSAQLGVRST
jgi:transposase